jgi:outer membrane biosynthesis protein TonB
MSPQPPPVNPLSRVLHIGERSTALLLAAAIGASTLIHSGFALAAYMRDVAIFPPEPTCRAGESIQLQAYAKTAWNSQLMVTNSAHWNVSDNKIASHTGAGFFRCISEGNVTITTSYLNRASTFTLKVDPAIIMVDVPKDEPPPPPPPPVEADPIPAPAPAAPNVKPDNTPPPPAAKVGNLLTATDDKTDDPNQKTYDFVTDPNGDEYGSGNAAKGGTAEHGGPGAAANGKPGGTGTGGSGAALGPAVQAKPAVDKSRVATFTVDNPCKGFFPADADDDVATVKVLVAIRPDGTVQTVSVLDENPKGQGFGKAARTCVGGAKFNPAWDQFGAPITASQTINIRFTR